MLLTGCLGFEGLVIEALARQGVDLCSFLLPLLLSLQHLIKLFLVGRTHILARLMMMMMMAMVTMMMMVMMMMMMIVMCC